MKHNSLSLRGEILEYCQSNIPSLAKRCTKWKLFEKDGRKTCAMECSREKTNAHAQEREYAFLNTPYNPFP